MRTVAAWLVGVCLAVSVCGESREARLAEFIAGTEVLRDAALVGPERRAAALAWLTERTGITVERARSMIVEYRNRPEDLRRLLEAVRAVMVPPEKEPEDATPEEARDGSQ